MMYFVDGAELMVETDSPALNVYKYIEFHCRWISLSYYNRMPLLQQASLWHFFPPEYSTINNQQNVTVISLLDVRILIHFSFTG